MVKEKEEEAKKPEAEDPLHQLLKNFLSAHKESRESLVMIGDEIHSLLALSKTTGEKTHEILQENDENLLKAFASLREGQSLLIDEEKKSTHAVKGLESPLHELKESFERFGDRLSEAAKEERERMEELLQKVTELSEKEGRVEEKMEEQLNSTLKILENFLNLEKEQNEKIEEISKTIAQSHQEMTAFLEEERKGRDEEIERERKRLAREENDRGVAHYYRRNFDAARLSFEECTKLDPSLVEGYNNLALALTELDHMEEAKENFKKAIGMRPDFSEAYNNLGLLHYRGKNFGEAVEYFQEALKRSDHFASAYINLGNAHYQLERFEDAIKSWEKALEIDPGSEEAKRALNLLKSKPK